MASVDPTAIPIRQDGVREEQMDGELLLYVPEATRAIYLNASAAVIWALCDGARSVAEIVSILAESYPEAGATIGAEVTATIDQLASAQVVTLA